MEERAGRFTPHVRHMTGATYSRLDKWQNRVAHTLSRLSRHGGLNKRDSAVVFPVLVLALWIETRWAYLYDYVVEVMRLDNIYKRRWLLVYNTEGDRYLT